MAIDVAHWLHGLGLGQYASTFARNDVDGSILLELTAEDLVRSASPQWAIGAGSYPRSPRFVTPRGLLYRMLPTRVLRARRNGDN